MLSFAGPAWSQSIRTQCTAIKEGDTLESILERRTSPTFHRQIRNQIDKHKMYNPHIKNWKHLPPGQTIYIELPYAESRIVEETECLHLFLHRGNKGRFLAGLGSIFSSDETEKVRKRIFGINLSSIMVRENSNSQISAKVGAQASWKFKSIVKVVGAFGITGVRAVQKSQVLILDGLLGLETPWEGWGASYSYGREVNSFEKKLFPKQEVKFFIPLRFDPINRLFLSYGRTIGNVTTSQYQLGIHAVF